MPPPGAAAQGRVRAAPAEDFTGERSPGFSEGPAGGRRAPGDVVEPVAGLPRVIWLYWHQGWANAPEVAARCLRSWTRHNPGWTIHALDRTSYPAWADLRGLARSPDTDFLPICLSDILRLRLLAVHGGVWADATCICRRPLDDWLHDHLDSGFFSLCRNGRPVSWFMAATPGNRLVETWWRETSDYWTDCPPELRRYAISRRPLIRLLRRSEGPVEDWRFHDYLMIPLRKLAGAYSGLRLSYPFRNLLRYCPYYWLCSLFRRSYDRDAQFREIWDRTPKAPPFGLAELGGPGLLAEPLSASTRGKIDESRAPVCKVSWKQNGSEIVPGTVLDYLTMDGLPGHPPAVRRFGLGTGSHRTVPAAACNAPTTVAAVSTGEERRSREARAPER